MGYDLFEAVIETGIDTVSAVLFCLEPEGSRMQLTICADCAGDMTLLGESFPCVVVWQDEDGLWYLTMAFEEGGSCA